MPGDPSAVASWPDDIPVVQVRVARPTDRLDEVVRFYRDGLGLEPIGDHLVVDPALPTGLGRLELLDIPGRWGRIDAFGRGRVDTAKRPR